MIEKPLWLYAELLCSIEPDDAPVLRDAVQLCGQGQSLSAISRKLDIAWDSVARLLDRAGVREHKTSRARPRRSPPKSGLRPQFRRRSAAYLPGSTPVTTLMLSDKGGSKMILNPPSTMKERTTLELDPIFTAYLDLEATRCGVSQAEIASVALALLAHFREQTAHGDAVLLSPPNPDAEGLSLSAVTVDRRHFSGLLETLSGATGYEIATKGDDDGRPHLRIVRTDE